MTSDTLTFDWRPDASNPGHVEVWFREHPELSQRNTPDAAVSVLLALASQLGGYRIEYPNGRPPGVRYMRPADDAAIRSAR